MSKLLLFLGFLGALSCKTRPDSRLRALHKEAVTKAASLVNIPRRYDPDIEKKYPLKKAKGVTYKWEKSALTPTDGFEVHRITLTTEKGKTEKITAARTFQTYKAQDNLSLASVYKLSKLLFPEKCLVPDAGIEGILTPYRGTTQATDSKAKTAFNLAFMTNLKSQIEGASSMNPQGHVAGICLYKTLGEIVLEAQTPDIKWPPAPWL